MFETFELAPTNGKENDYSETLYICISVSSHTYSFHLCWETNGSCFDYADTGDTKEIGWQRGEDVGSRVQVSDAQWWHDVIRGTIEQIIIDQTPINDVDKFLASEDGSWLVDFTVDDFAAEKWYRYHN